MGLGGGAGRVNGHTHRYVLILPGKRVFLFFGIKASLGDDVLFPTSKGTLIFRSSISVHGD